MATDGKDQSEGKFPALTEADWLRLRADLKDNAKVQLNDAQMAALKAAMGAAAQTWRDWNAAKAAEASRAKFAKEFSDTLQALEELLARNSQAFSAEIATGELTYHLTYAACEAAIGPEAFAKGFPKSAVQRARKASANLLDEYGLIDLECALPFKGRLDKEHAPELAMHMIRVLRTPFERAQKPASKGGRPRDIARTALILHLAYDATRILFANPSDEEIETFRISADDNSTFLELCNQVAPYCGVEEAGLQDAAKRILKRHREALKDGRWPSMKPTPAIPGLAALLDEEEDVEPEFG